MRVYSILALAATIACSSNSHPGNAPDAGSTRGDYDPMPFGGARPTLLYVPSGYSDSAPAPLVILLHGYGATGGIEDLYLQLRIAAESHGMLYAHPDGLLDSSGNRYWNATDACCDFARTNADDVKYLSDLAAEIGTRYKVDPKRIYIAGHSNGAFMAYRLACDRAALIAGIMSLAGDTWFDKTRCAPSAPVAILQVQGTADEVIAYDGGTTGDGGVYPGAQATVATWVGYNGCSSVADTSSPPLDLDYSLPGAETKVTKFASGCRANGQVELWSVDGGLHVPKFSLAFANDLLDWLQAHPKP